LQAAITEQTFNDSHAVFSGPLHVVLALKSETYIEK